MAKQYLLPAIALCFVLTSLSHAENQQGTGLNSVEVTLTTDQRLVLQAQGQTINLIGSIKSEGDYSELILDQLSDNGTLIPNWGKAEVLLGCYQADVLLYQEQSGGWQEVAALSVAIDSCNR